MYPDLLGQKTIRHMTDENMASVIGVTRKSYVQKIKSGRFTPIECAKNVRHFDKHFDYLFALDEDISFYTR